MTVVFRFLTGERRRIDEVYMESVPRAGEYVRLDNRCYEVRVVVYEPRTEPVQVFVDLVVDEGLVPR